MKVTFETNFDEIPKRLRVLLKKSLFESESVVNDYADSLYDETLQQVPIGTGTLASSAYKEVHKTGLAYEAEVGYGGNGDKVNPVSRARPSEYMLRVHEDLSAHHPNGKAKFLEDPANELNAKFGNKLVQAFKRIVKW